MRKMGTKSWIDGFVSFLFFEKRKPMHTTDCTVARGTLTGTSSVFCPWVLGDSLPVMVARPGEALLGEALLTEAVELSPDGCTSWPGPGFCFFCSSRMCSVTLWTISSILSPDSEFLFLFRTFLIKPASSVLKGEGDK